MSSGNFLLALILALFCLPATAELNRLEEAKSLYEQGQWENSARVLSSAAQENHSLQSSSLFYNLALAYFKSGKLPLAALSLNKALALNPFHSVSIDLLKIVEPKLSAKTLYAKPHHQLEWWPSVFRSFSWPPWLALTLIVLFFVPIVRMKSSIVASYSLLVISAFLLLATIVAAWDNRLPEGGALSAMQALAGPGETYPEIAAIEIGSRFSIEDTREGWVKIRQLDSNKKSLVGWIRADQVFVIR